MAEYIDREAAYDVLTDYYHHSTDTQHEALREALSRVPAAYVAPIVRCKDCAWWHYQWPPQSALGGRHYCANIDISTPKDFYCAFGEKRQESEEEK